MDSFNTTSNGTVVAQTDVYLSHRPVKREWTNPSFTERGQPYSFHTVPESALLLFEVSAFEVWPVIMYRATDITEVGLAPKRFSNDVAAVFFMVFVQNPCCRETIVLHDLDDRYPHGIQQ